MVHSVLLFPWSERQEYSSHIFPHSFSFMKVSPSFPFLPSPFSHSLVCASSSSCLLPLLPATPWSLHLFTKVDNEPHWAVMGFHSICAGFPTHSHPDIQAIHCSHFHRVVTVKESKRFPTPGVNSIEDGLLLAVISFIFVVKKRL